MSNWGCAGCPEQGCARELQACEVSSELLWRADSSAQPGGQWQPGVLLHLGMEPLFGSECLQPPAHTAASSAMQHCGSGRCAGCWGCSGCWVALLRLPGVLVLLPALQPMSGQSFVLPTAMCLPPASRALQEKGKPVDVPFQALGSVLCPKQTQQHLQ